MSMDAKMLSPKELVEACEEINKATRFIPSLDGQQAFSDYVAGVRAHIAALEADNAALLAILKDGAESEQDDDTWSDRVLLAIAQPHPGVALLEEHRKELAAAAARHETTRATMQVREEEHRKALEPLRGVADALAEEMERAVYERERPRGGQAVPFHGDFSQCPPSMVGRPKWWARELRTALAGAHGKDLVRARNEGLERAATYHDHEAVSLRTNIRWYPENAAEAEAHESAATAIRAMKEPEE